MTIRKLKDRLIFMVVLLTTLSFVPQIFAQDEAVALEDLPERVADKLIPIEDLSITDCPEWIESQLQNRVVAQIIENTYYQWNEYDLIGANGATEICVVLARPESKPLSKEKAHVLLSASNMWTESQPVFDEMTTLSASDASLQIPAIQPSRPNPSFKAPPGPDKGTSSLQDDVFEAGVEHVLTKVIAPAEEEVVPESIQDSDDRTRISATTSHPWNTVCYISNSLGRGSGALISPYCVLTAGHVVYHQDTSTWATFSSFAVTPAQYQYSEGENYYRPYGRNVGVSELRSNNAYTGGGGYDYDYGAALFNTRFSSSISTFMPLVFDYSPDLINLAGYPKVVQDETNSYGMWHSTSDAWVQLQNNRILNYYADTSGGNSGGPVWVYSGGTRRIVAVHNYGALPWNGGARLVSANQNLITEWMQWTPPDVTDPAVTITSPTSNPTYSTSSSSLDIDGTASDNVGVTLVSWSNNRGGSGDCTGTTSWSKNGITLSSGQNIITVTAGDAAGNTGTDTLTVTYTPPAGNLQATPSGGLTSSGSQAGPFSPSTNVYTITNTGGNLISWTASKTASWLSLSSTGGSLAAGANVTVTVSINNNADSLGPGSYSDTVRFANTTNGNGDTTIPVNLTVSGSVDVYTLSISRTGSGSVRVNDTRHSLPWSGQFASGAQVQLEATPNSGWSFSRWSGDLTGSTNPTTISMGADKRVTAIFAESALYDLTVKIAGSGYVELDPDGGSYDSVTEVGLTATADPGWVFSGWSGDLISQDNPEAIVMNSDKNVTATFLKDSDTEIEDFVTRFYQLCLGREPDPAGLDGWVPALLNGTQTGSDVANGFVFSQEFINKNTTNEEYLTVLYEAFFNRQPDAGGWQGWLGAMNRGASREVVLKGFIYAQEFASLCEEYGIRAFPQNDPVSAFVTRFYQLCLDRDPDAAGLDGWTNDLLNQIQTGANVANGFIYSQEFINKNTTNEEYLTILYKAFFNREPDQAGWEVWLSELNGGKDRGYVLNGFLGSQEFINLCEDYGIDPN